MTDVLDRQFDLGAEEGKPVPRLVNLIIREALGSGTSQVHMTTGALAVRFFRMGAWIEVMRLPAQVFAPVINRIRVMAGLDRTKGKTRQEGTVEVIAEGAPVPIKVVVQFTEAGDEEVYLHLPSSEQE